MTPSSPTIEDEQKRREALRSKSFRMVLEIAFIFGIPVLLAYWGGKFMDQRFDTGKTGTLALLGVAFVISWVIIIRKAMHINRGFRASDASMKKTQEAVASNIPSSEDRSSLPQ